MPFQCKIRAGGRWRIYSLASAACLFLTACSGGQDYAFHPIDEIPQGQGLITDESGEFTLAKIDLSKNRDERRETAVSTPAPTQPQTVVSTSGITEAVTPE